MFAPLRYNLHLVLAKESQVHGLSSTAQFYVSVYNFQGADISESLKGCQQNQNEDVAQELAAGAGCRATVGRQSTDSRPTVGGRELFFTIIEKLDKHFM